MIARRSLLKGLLVLPLALVSTQLPEDKPKPPISVNDQGRLIIYAPNGMDVVGYEPDYVPLRVNTDKPPGLSLEGSKWS